MTLSHSTSSWTRGPERAPITARPRKRMRKDKDEDEDEDDDDENGERSMEMVDNLAGFGRKAKPTSPHLHWALGIHILGVGWEARMPWPENTTRVSSVPLYLLTSTSNPQAQSKTTRTRARQTHPRTTRPIARTSDVDFDKVPSPRSPRSTRRSAGAGPSRLGTQELLEHDEEERDYSGGDGGGGGSPRQLSFTEMDSRDDEEEGGRGGRGARTTHTEAEKGGIPKEGRLAKKVASPKKVVSPNKGKGKGKAAPEPEPDEDMDMEDDIARGMEDVDMELPPSDEEEPVQPPSKKSAKGAAKGKEKATATRTVTTMTRRQKENRDVPPGVRRSARTPYPPLEWWRNEKVEYGGRDPEDGPILVPRIKAIITIPKEPVVPLGKHGRAARKRSRTPAAQDGKAGKERVKIVEKIVEVPVDSTNANPEEGWDDETETQAMVKAYPSNKDVTRRIAFTARMFAPTPAANNEWFFQKIFGDGDFIAAGQIVIPPKGRKPSKPSKDNTFIFFVIEGAVNLKVCDTSLIIASGGMFMIPRGNTYFIENIAERDAKLFFTQARKMREGERDDEDEDEQQQQRVSSSGPAPVQRGGQGSSSQPPPGRAVSVAVNGHAKEKEVRRGMSANV
ncbi:CENP-C-C domain-containing protein [Mycena venus]|uniref:CENP-C homolog n=1 Tax=Mycena venus TaxID=2733690 RepID=A0A8H7CIT1_9AGAR|nr:CENP-C-C domain-containing protein [Mycena venus]